MHAGLAEADESGGAGNDLRDRSFQGAAQSESAGKIHEHMKKKAKQQAHDAGVSRERLQRCSRQSCISRAEDS